MAYRSQYTGEQIDNSIKIAGTLDKIQNGWVKIISGEDNVFDLDTLYTTGNYVVQYWKNGPTFFDTLNGPLNVTVTKINDIEYQLVNYLSYTYMRSYNETGSTWNEWNLDKDKLQVTVGSEYILGEPEDGAVWINTSGDNTHIYVYDTSSHKWVESGIEGILTNDDIPKDLNDEDLYEYIDRKINDPLEVDGVRWIQSNVTTGSFRCAAYGNDIYVAGSTDKGLWYSKDGISWTQSKITSLYIYDLTYWNGYFIAGTNGNGIYTSTDGNEWATSNITNKKVFFFCNSEPYITASTNTGLYYSSNGTTWSVTNMNTGSYYDMAYLEGSNSEHYTVACSHADKGVKYSTGDTSTWSDSNITNGSYYGAGVGCNALYVGSTADTNTGIWVATNPELFIQCNIDTGGFSAFAGNDEMVVAGAASGSIVGRRGLYYAYKSSLTTFYQSNVTSGSFYSIEYKNNSWIASSIDNGVWYSKNGTNWYRTNITADINTRGLCYGDGTWLLGGNDSATGIYYSLSLLTGNNNPQDHYNDTVAHITEEERQLWNSKATKHDLETIRDNIIKTLESYADTQLSSKTDSVSALLTTINGYIDILNTHINNTTIHPSSSKQSEWDNKAEADHTHNLDGRVTVLATNINGTISLSLIDKSALERLTTVADDTARLALTTDTVQNGDQVYVEDTQSFYFVIDDTKLTSEDGYIKFATAITSMDWSGITNKPTTLSGYGITNAYTTSEVNTKLNSANSTITTALNSIQALIDAGAADVDLDELRDKLDEMLEYDANLETTINEYCTAINTELTTMNSYISG
jgi:hypothetical protein